MKTTDEAFNAYVRSEMLKYRDKHNLTQERMAECLHISRRCYQAQEEGHCGFSGQTICRFLVILPAEEVLIFVYGIPTDVWDKKNEA